MAKPEPEAAVGADRIIGTTRVFDAPREMVWKMWTDLKHVVKWWGPNGFTTTIDVMEVKVGGTWRFVMHGPDGMDYPNIIVYEEVVKPERLLYTHGSDVEPDMFRVTVTFDAEGNKTRLTMQSVFKTAEARREVEEKYQAVDGMYQTLGRLSEYLKSL